MMKLDFERAVLNRVPEMEAHPERHFREVLFLCDEYQHFATVGESDPTVDAKTNSKLPTACPKAGTTPKSVGSRARPSPTKPTSSLPRATTPRATTAST